MQTIVQFDKVDMYDGNSIVVNGDNYIISMCVDGNKIVCYRTYRAVLFIFRGEHINAVSGARGVEQDAVEPIM